jgi:hypothetical protein
MLKFLFELAALLFLIGIVGPILFLLIPVWMLAA